MGNDGYKVGTQSPSSGVDRNAPTLADLESGGRAKKTSLAKKAARSANKDAGKLESQNAPKSSVSKRELWEEKARELERMSRRGQAKRDAAFNKNMTKAATQDLSELSTRHDRPRSEIFNGAGVKLPGGKSVTAQSLRSDLDAAQSQLDAIQETHPDLHKRLSGHISESRNAIDALSAKDSKYSFATKAVVASIVNLPLMALPLLLATDPAKIKDVESGESRLSKDFLMLMAGYQAKSIALLASHVSSPLSNAATLKKGVIERQAYDVMSFLTGAPAAFSKSFQQGFGQTAAHSVLRGTLLTGSLNSLFQSDAVGKFGNRVATSVQSLATTGTMEGTTRYPRLERQAKDMTDDQKQLLTTIAGALSGTAVDLQAANSALIADGIKPSPTYTEHSGSALSSMFKAVEEMEHIGAPKTDSPDSNSAVVNNADRNEKALIFAVTVGIYAANLALVFDDPLTLVDTAADAGVVLPIIWSSVNDPAVDATGAKDRFKAFAGTSLLSAFLLGADEALGKPTEKNNNVFYVMLGVFAAASLTLPSPVSSKFVDILDKATKCCSSKDGATADVDADGRDEALREGLELVTSVVGTEPGKIAMEDLAENVGEGLDILLSAQDDRNQIEEELKPDPRIEEITNDEGTEFHLMELGLIVRDRRSGGNQQDPLSTGLSNPSAGSEDQAYGDSLLATDLPTGTSTEGRSIFDIAAQGRTPEQIEEERKRSEDPRNII